MYRVTIYYKDTDAGGVVYYGNYLRYFEAARTEFLRERGAALTDWIDRGVLFVVVRAEVDYRLSARYGDILGIETRCPALSGARFDLAYRVLREQDGALVATGLTRMACVNEKGRPLRIPAEIREILAGASAPKEAGSRGRAE